MPKDKNSIRVLLIDDEEMQYFLIKVMVRKFQFINVDLEWVDTYEKACEMAKAGEHSMYLIDYRLGPRSGLELVQELSQINKNKACSYVIMTGFADTEVEDEAFRSGVDDFISKDDINGSLLERTIRYTVASKANFLELEKSRNQYKQIYLNTDSPVVEVSTELDVLRVNKAFNTCFGYPEDFDPKSLEVKEKIWAIIGDELEKERIVEHIQGQRRRTAEIFECRSKDGSAVIIQMNVYTLLDANGVESYQVVMNDITQRVLKDRQINQQHRLELMEKMARIVAHEVRNPLSNIVMSSEQLTDLVLPDGSMLLDIIRRNSIRIEHLISKFLRTFKQVEVEKSIGSVEGLISTAVSEFKDKAQLTGVRLETNIDGDLVDLPFDAEQLGLVLNNLINNAIQACDKIPAAFVNVRASMNGDQVEIRVTDNGVGVSKEDAKLLFEPFFTKKPNGLGLGLTSAQNIIRSHGGTLDIEFPERGATFLIALPTQ